MIEPSTPTKDCPNPEQWSALDSDTCENEVLDFLRVLVATIKPRYVVETGTCYGWSARAMGQALINGRLDTCDPEDKNLYAWPSNVKYHKCSSLDFKPTAPIDLLFLDSALNLRVLEYLIFKEHLSERAVVVIHDAGETHHEFLAEVREKLKDELEFVILPTPRGLLIGRPKI